MARMVVIAGEASGDRLGARLIQNARKLDPALEVEGIAGPQMQAAGCKAWFDSESLAVMGLFEVLQHLPRLLKIRREVKRRLKENPPDLLLGIDAPDFNLPVEKFARRLGIATIHYVCPQIWAWREGRVKTLRKSCDEILCVFPFEPEFLAGHGIRGEFVGHPLADDIPDRVDQDGARRSFGLGDGTVIAVMPGSRESEVSRLGPAFAGTAQWLAGKLADVTYVVPVAAPKLRPMIEQHFAEHAPDARVVVVDGRSQDVIAAADIVLLASGTASLEVLLSKKPMVVAYKLALPTYYVARLMLATGFMRMEHFAQPNLLAGRSLVPELVQHEVTPERLGNEILSLLGSTEYRADLIAEFAAIHDALRRSAGQRSARAALELIQERNDA